MVWHRHTPDQTRDEYIHIPDQTRDEYIHTPDQTRDEYIHIPDQDQTPDEYLHTPYTLDVHIAYTGLPYICSHLFSPHISLSLTCSVVDLYPTSKNYVNPRIPRVGTRIRRGSLTTAAVQLCFGYHFTFFHQAQVW